MTFNLILPEIGHFLLIMALFIAFWMGIAPFVSKVREKHPIVLPATLFILILIAFAILTFCFLSDNFSVKYVAENSSINLPWWYKICAVWGAHEGSILLWILVLSGWTLAVTVFNRWYQLPENMLIRTLSVLGWIAVGFLLFLLLTSNPFARLLPNIPSNGQDLNPLLQDIGFLFHPPILYMGYVGLSVPFALAIASLWLGEWNTKWAGWARVWTLSAWCFLTIGITLGSWWAYRELGWGGFWFWDPVENASFMPWLSATALLHSLFVTEKRQTFKAWTTFLAIISFVLSLLGTFLVRSGILTSVHAFASDPSRGLFMLIFLFIVVLIAMILFSWRIHRLQKTIHYAFLSRETFLMFNNILLFTIMLTILLGTLYPLIMQVCHWGKLSVGAPYFNTVFSLLMLPVLFLMALGPLTPWQSFKTFNADQSQDFSHTIQLVFCLSLILGLLLPWLFLGNIHPAAAIGIFLSLWIIIATGIMHWKKRHWGVFFSHLGMGVALAGIVVSSSYSLERTLIMSEKDVATLGPYLITFQSLKTLQGPNYSGLISTFTIQKTETQKLISTIHPEKRYYPIQKTVMTEAAIDPGIFRDIYIALGDQVQNNDHDWVIRMYYKPLVRWIWAGGFLILLGGLCAIKKRFEKLARARSNMLK